MLSFRQRIYFQFYSTDDNALNAFCGVAVGSYYREFYLFFKPGK